MMSGSMDGWIDQCWRLYSRVFLSLISNCMRVIIARRVKMEGKERENAFWIALFLSWL